LPSLTTISEAKEDRSSWNATQIWV